MSLNTPQTLSVKRKRDAPPVDTLVAESKRLRSDSFSLKRKLDLPERPENEDKRAKTESPEGTVIWRRVTKASHGHIRQSAADVSPQTPTRRFHVSRAAGTVVLFEHQHATNGTATAGADGASAMGTAGSKPGIPEQVQAATPRKRPGAGTALKAGKRQPIQQKGPTAANGPSEEVIRQFEKFSNEVENEGVHKVAKPSSPSTFKPKAPKLRFKDRHPAQAAALNLKDPNAMDVDTDEYVYDTYVREVIMPDAEGKVPEPPGTIGVVVISEEDEEWWFGEDGSDKEYDTDDEDENAEDYYANDYPEDEMSSDDEFERQPYSYHHGENDEEYDLNDDARSVEDDDQLFRQAIPKSRAVYWGCMGEK